MLHEQRRGVYGSPRIWADLVLDDGERIGRKRVERLMRQAGLSGLITRRSGRPRRSACRASGSPTISSIATSLPALRTALGRRHHLPAHLGGLAVPGRRAGPLQPPDRRLGMADHMRTELVTDALQMALAHRRPEPGLIWHSDQGSQFVSLAFGQQARAAGIAQSMGSKGDCFDNAVAESFFATLKKELIHRRSLADQDRAAHRGLRLHRGLLQPRTPPLSARRSLTSTVRDGHSQTRPTRSSSRLSPPCPPKRVNSRTGRSRGGPARASSWRCG